MRHALFVILSSAMVCLSSGRTSAQSNPSPAPWLFDRVDTIDGAAASPMTDWPAVVETSLGKAADFDGINDGLFLRCAPLDSARAFTIEVVFRPDSNDLTGEKNQPRILHIRSAGNNNRRITMEMRIFENRRWILDTYIRSEVSNLTQIDSSKTHSIGEWHHAALVYGDSVMKQYVDGREQLSGRVVYLPIDTPRISVGVRQDPRYWFDGAIRMIKITKRALAPSEFTIPFTVGVGSVPGRPADRLLLENYPNPFNPETMIRYRLPASGRVKIGVYDVVGREVAVLVDAQQSAGSHRTTWNAARMPSGVYICRMQSAVPEAGGSNERISTRRIVVLK